MASDNQQVKYFTIPVLTNVCMCSIIATGAYDHIIRIWEWQSSTVLQQLHGHKSHINALLFDKVCHRYADGHLHYFLLEWNKVVCRRW